MKAVAYDGVAAVTTDEVADALMQLALAVAQFGSYESASIPVIVAGRTQRLTVMLGPTIHLSVITTADDPVDVDGTAETEAALHDRVTAITDPLRNLHLPIHPSS